MFKMKTSIFLWITMLTSPLVAQRLKLYKDFDSKSIAARFNHNRNGLNYRLPNATYPIRYDIALTTRIDEADFEFSGQVQILLHARDDTNSITLHSKMHTINSVLLARADGSNIAVKQFELDLVTEFLIVTTEMETLLAGSNYTLIVAYAGVLRTDDGGFYRSSYLDETGKKHWLAITQFQESDARHGFPCYDEPGLRSLFSIRITHGRIYHALSNMPEVVVIDTPDPSMVTTIFQVTPLMSAYLVAFVISDFNYITNRDTRDPTDLLQNVYGQPSAITNGKADFALDAGIKIMHQMEDYFGFPYTLPKMDQIALPDFSAGAMENWGLVTYQELYLYYDNGTSTFQQLDWVATIISHEYAHQWFGNLIALRWWDVLWMNEGFATLYEFMSTDAVFPEWRIHDLMVVNILQTVFDQDAYESTRPMTYYVESQEDVRKLFDFVAYDKSGCVLRMIQHALTEEIFAKGLNNYIEDMKFKTTGPDDLYRNLQLAVENEDDISIKAIMDSWANQKGFPMLFVSRTATGELIVTQERFLLQTEPESEDLSWWIPYNFVVQNTPNFTKTTPDGWIQQGVNSITLVPTISKTWTENEWIIFNKQQTGYYRVNYDSTLWRLITEELVQGDFSKIHVLNRAQLIDDIYAFARVDRVTYSMVFDLLDYLSKELDYAPWAPAGRALDAIDKRMASLKSYNNFKIFVHDKVQPLFKSLGVHNKANDTYFDRLARNVGISWACYVGSRECLSATNNRLNDFILSGNLIEADVRSTVLCNGLRQAEEDVFLAIFIRMMNMTDPLERNRLVYALGCSQNPDFLRSYLWSSLTVTDSTANERTRILNAVIQGGIVGARAVLQFLDINFTQTNNRYSFESVINNLAQWIGNEELYAKFEHLTNSLLIAGQITIETKVHAISVAEENLQWANDYGAEVTEWLDLYVNRVSHASSEHTLSLISLLITFVLSVFNFK